MHLFKKSAARHSYEIDMIHGGLLGKIVHFSLSLMLSNILQLLYNAADLIVVGQLSASKTAVGAIGATGNLTGLIVNAVIGLSVGSGVLVAQGYGKNDRDATEKAVHTSISLAGIMGIVVAVIGVLFSRTFLSWMNTSEAILDQSALYMQIYFLGAPFNMLYNFGGAILRATGDTKRPFYFLAVSGALNVVLNVFFVVVCQMDVAGVAIATVASQILSAVFVILCLMRQDTLCRLFPKKLRIHSTTMRRMLHIGLPASIQSSMFGISNTLIQSSINSFDIPFASLGITPYTSGNAASCNIESFVYMTMNAFYHAALNFTGQNQAAGKWKRTKKILTLCLACVTVTGALLGAICVIFGRPLLGIYLPKDPEAVSYGYRRLVIICSTYFLCGIMDVIVGQLRGLGKSTVPMIVSIVGICVYRVLWIGTVFAANRSWELLFLSYPISWVLTGAAQFFCYLIIQRKFPKEDADAVSEVKVAAP